LYSSISLEGKLVEGKNNIEILIDKISYLHEVEEELVLGKNEISLEKLREVAHLRPKTKYFQAVFKIRSYTSHAIHKFFMEKDYHYVHSPIITSNDAEGGGEAFLITDQKGGTFFQDQGSLTVSGQLHAEGFAQAFTKTYTFGPTFRAENSNTTKHAAEF
jgi:asparaginyl-tRNA synthetase